MAPRQYPAPSGSPNRLSGKIPQEMRNEIYEYLEPSYKHLHVGVHMTFVFRDHFNTPLGPRVALRLMNKGFRGEMNDKTNRERDTLVVDMVLDRLMHWRLYAHNRPNHNWEQYLDATHALSQNTVRTERDTVIAKYDHLRLVVPFLFMSQDGNNLNLRQSVLYTAHFQISRENGAWVLKDSRWLRIHNGGFVGNGARTDAERRVQTWISQRLGQHPLSSASLTNLCSVLWNNLRVDVVPGGHWGTGSFRRAMQCIEDQQCDWNAINNMWSPEATQVVQSGGLQWWRYHHEDW